MQRRMWVIGVGVLPVASSRLWPVCNCEHAFPKTDVIRKLPRKSGKLEGELAILCIVIDASNDESSAPENGGKVAETQGG